MADRIFLTRDELRALTGTADRGKQAACLRANRIPYTLDIFSRPVVTLAAITGQPAAKEPGAVWAGPSFMKAV